MLPEWLRSYNRTDLSFDLVAGIVVATMLVPQAMSYALLAELPVEVGLYAGLLPVAIYAFLGTSRFLAVGPVAMVSLLVARGIGPIAQGDVGLAVELALLLALMVGVIQLAMGILRAGFLVNFLSHPVLSGFTSAAAVVIGASQLKHLLGVQVSSTERPYELFAELARQAPNTNAPVLAIGLIATALLISYPCITTKLLTNRGWSSSAVAAWSRCGPLVVVVLGTLAAWLFRDSFSIPTVGETPSGLPDFALPTLNGPHLQMLLPTALVISLIGFMESYSVAQALATKRRQRVKPNRELVALGAANLGAAISGGYPVTGGFSRSAVNFQAGARTRLASLVTAVFMACTLLFLTPLLTFLPKAVLAAIILVAVASLFDAAQFWHLRRYSLADAACWLVTFASVFVVGIESGVAVGALSSVAFFLWRTSRPHVAVVGRLGKSEHYRNVKRHPVTTEAGVLALRIDESLYFANVRGLEERLIEAVAADPSLRHVLLICSGINFIDATGLDSLESILVNFAQAGVSLNLAEVKGPVTDRLARVGFLEKLGAKHLFLSTHEAMTGLALAPPLTSSSASPHDDRTRKV